MSGQELANGVLPRCKRDQQRHIIEIAVTQAEAVLLVTLAVIERGQSMDGALA